VSVWQLPHTGDAPASGKHSHGMGALRGEIIAAHCLGNDCLIILGRGDSEIAAEGLATTTPPSSEQGRFRSVSWPKDDSGHERCYIAAVRLAAIGAMRTGEALLLHGPAAKGATVVHLPSLTPDVAAFAGVLRGHAGARLNPAVKFLLETFSSRASRQLEGVSAFLAAILDGVSQEDGVIEILGAIEGEGLLLQGWLCHPLVGRQRLLLLDDVLEEHEAICANFARSDLEGRGVGVLALVRPKSAIRLDALRNVYLRAGDHFYRLTVLPNVMRLREDEAPNHLRAMMPSLQVEEALQRNLRGAARPRFTGADTVSSLDQPVRMAIDIAAHIPAVGWYLTGWLLDPTNRVAKAMLRDRGGMAERLDLRWTRVPRSDVSAGFRNDPRFAGRINHDAHGFTIFVPHRAGEAQAWIELQLSDDHAAFLPFQGSSGEGSDGRKRLLESFDIHKACAHEIVEQHVGPLFHAAKALPRRDIGYRRLRARAAKGVQAELIIPLVDPAIRTKILVAELASRNPGAGIVPVLVCSPAIADATDRLLHELAFYRLDAEVLLADRSIDGCEALEIGLRATKAERLVLMAPSTHPLKENWAAELIALLGTGAEPMVVTPTLLYEDWSICYAGIEGMRFLDAFPYADAAYARAGYPREALPAATVAATLAGSLDCCAMTRSAFEKLGGFSAGYALPRANGLDLFLRMRKAGVRVSWVSQVEAYTLAESGAQSDYWMKTGELVDGWSLRASWKDRLPPVLDVVSGLRSAESAPAASPIDAALGDGARHGDGTVAAMRAS
jgi:hypothetical protein